ncbi:unnamed protein product [Cylindrotheca closterium]|uniref:Hexosyltransferase n=1 Tax=Cylindrotheca closterium TaxID=2856 RepID=A0AAD2CJ57_9STRA|nr:unnamed protein product [Cylindrotheca closterium]
MKQGESRRNSEDNDSSAHTKRTKLQSFLLRHPPKSRRGFLPIVFLVTLIAISKETSSIRNFQGNQSSARRQILNEVKHTPEIDDSSSTGPKGIINYLIYVVTLQGVKGADDSNIGRYDNFKRHWNILCHQDDQLQEQFHFHTCRGHLSPKGTPKGYGLSVAYLDCFRWAIQNHNKWHRENNPNATGNNGLDDDSIPFVFLEDDSRLYNSNFCHSSYRNRIWQSLPQTNATLLMLGGHGMAFQNSSHPIARVYQDHYYDETLLMDPSVLPQFIRVQRGFGSYGFALLNTPSVEYMARKMNNMLNRTFDAKGMKGFKAIDQQFHHYGVLRTLMTYPWIVYHEGGLYSNTKGAVRGEFGDGSKQYRWISGLTGSFKNCSSDDNVSSKDHIGLSNSNRDDGPYQEGTVQVACRGVTFRIPRSFSSSQGNSTSTGDVILTAVISASNHADRRASIRSTWAKGSTDVFFVVAGPWEEIASEFQEHHDLVWIDNGGNGDNVNATNMLSSLQVATFLTIADVQYGNHYSHILKVTDHSYAKLSAIRSNLFDNGRQKIAMYGTHCGTGVRPSHVGVSETEYSDFFFPQYCKGDGYALSRLFLLCAISHIPQSRLVSLDDAYIGILGERCGLEANQFHSGADVEEGKMPLLQHDLKTTTAMEEYHGKQLNATLYLNHR